MAAKNTFQERFRELRERVGDGVLKAELVFDQPYAAKQHNELSYRHPRGGGPGYVSKPLVSHYRDWYEDIADHVLDGELKNTFKKVVEEWADKAEDAAPVETRLLRKSAHPAVFDNEVASYDRPPLAPREPDYVRNGRPGWQWNRGEGRRPGWDD